MCVNFPSNTEEIFYWNLTDQFIPNDDLYIQYRIPIMNFNIDYLKKYKLIALDIIQQMKKPICCVHVRRTDYLYTHL